MLSMLVNKENNTFYYLLNGIYYPLELDTQLRLIKNNGTSAMLTKKEVVRLGLCYDNINETLTNVSDSQLIEMANKY